MRSRSSTPSTTSATKESAPYLGSYISKETLKTDEFAAKIAEKCGLPAIQVQAIIAGAFDAIEELEKEELVRLHVDGFTVCGIITGSFPTADAKFDPERNALQLALRLDEVISKQLFTAHTAELLEGGDYKLVIKSRADDAAGPLQTATKRVKYLRVVVSESSDTTRGQEAASTIAGWIGLAPFVWRFWYNLPHDHKIHG